MFCSFYSVYMLHVCNDTTYSASYQLHVIVVFIIIIIIVITLYCMEIRA
jgi:hypothetical protein